MVDEAEMSGQILLPKKIALLAKLNSKVKHQPKTDSYGTAPTERKFVSNKRSLKQVKSTGVSVEAARQQHWKRGESMFSTQTRLDLILSSKEDSSGQQQSQDEYTRTSFSQRDFQGIGRLNDSASDRIVSKNQIYHNQMHSRKDLRGLTESSTQSMRETNNYYKPAPKKLSVINGPKMVQTVFINRKLVNEKQTKVSAFRGIQNKTRSIDYMKLRK